MHCCNMSFAMKGLMREIDTAFCERRLNPACLEEGSLTGNANLKKFPLFLRTQTLSLIYLLAYGGTV